MIDGMELKLDWTPSPDQLWERVRKKWPKAVRMSGVTDTLYFENAKARKRWKADKLTTDSVFQATWRSEDDQGCWLTGLRVASPIMRYLINWGRPVHVGDTIEVYRSLGLHHDKETFVRKTTVTKVTRCSFNTADGIRWSLRGMTPWAGSRYDPYYQAKHV